MSWLIAPIVAALMAANQVICAPTDHGLLPVVVDPAAEAVLECRKSASSSSNSQTPPQLDQSSTPQKQKPSVGAGSDILIAEENK